MHSFIDVSSVYLTEIDSFGKWIVEQKFNSEENKVYCRASMKGYGTWFGERIRLDDNGEVLITEDVIYKNKSDVFSSLIDILLIIKLVKLENLFRKSIFCVP